MAGQDDTLVAGFTPAPDGTPPEAHKRIAGYEILSKLGHGGMGAVYKARQVSLDRTVALKVLPKALTDRPDFIHRFSYEARVTGNLNHPNIIKVYDVGKSAMGIWYYSMECVEGESLKAALEREKQLAPGKVLKILEEMASALDHAFKHGVIHRDIKPDNILIDHEGNVKLADLGLAKLSDGTDLSAGKDSSSVSMPGTVLGTPHYMSPEQAAGKPVDTRSDLYSLGATAYHLLAGATPFSADSAMEVISKHLSEPVPPLGEKAPGAPASLVAVVHRLMEKDAAARFQTPAELMSALSRVRREWVSSPSASRSGVHAAPGGAVSADLDGPRPEIEKLLEAAHKFKASDLHLKAGAPPIFRVGGTPTPIQMPPLTVEQVHKLVFETLTPEMAKVLEQKGDLDFAYFLPDGRRFRMNAFRDRGSYALAARRINTVIPKFKELYLPEKPMSRIAGFEEGMVLLAGVTGSGKSTTIASILDYINERGRYHIITVEDPIEYVFQDKKSFINQREIGSDTQDFKTAMKALMRQDPDIIVAGEMRDAETFEFGLTAAETGHLVFGTLHGANVAQCFGRILDLFPPERHEQIRHGLHFNLKAIVCQKLLPSIKPGIPRVPVVEVMITNPSIKDLIEKNEISRIPDIVANGEAEGMQDFTQALCKLVKEGFIDEKTALQAAPNPEQLKMALQGFSIKGGTF